MGPKLQMAEVGADVVLLARRPILDADGTVRGYELRFRRPDGTGWPSEDEASATAQTLVAAFADLSLGAVTSASKAWITTPAQFLLDTDLSVLPSDRVVLELLEPDDVDPAFTARAAELARDGYELALGDFRWRADTAALLDVATYVKLDVQALGFEALAAMVARLAPYDVRIVADNVETADEADACAALGITLLEGFFFQRPRLVHGRRAPSGAIGRLRQATALSTTATFEEVEQLVRHDLGLSVRVLRYINSAAVALTSNVSSIRHALMMVGTNTVRQWLLLVLMGDLGKLRPAVLGAGLVRARICETIARMSGTPIDSAFIVGLLSVCDALLDTPLDEIIAELPLTDDVAAAILHHQGPLGEILATAVDLERGTSDVRDPARAYALHQAVRWANEQLDEVAAA